MSVSHFIENIGDTPSKTLSGFALYMDVSPAQWMTLTPHELVEARLKLNRDMLDGLPKDKRPVV
jgi:oxalate decarboxylase/phosphoglucose isomerase-like protein (cupin superfamily)